MSSQKVTQLRKEGKIQEAFELAQELMKTNPDDIWNKRAIAWVYYEILKQNIEKEKNQKIIELLKQINQLQLPADEEIFYKSIAWLFAKYVNSKQLEPENLYFIFLEFQKMHFPKPQESYTFLLKAFSKHALQWDEYLDFVQWWNLDNFADKDYEKTELDNRKKILSDVERIYIQISKKVLQEPVNKQSVDWFLPYIENLVQKYPRMQYPPYYFAKILLAAGKKEHFLKAFIPFARKKKNDFWVWDLMSEIFEKTDTLYLACLCRSLVCKADIKFTVNVKEKLASVLINKNLLSEAKHEIEQIVHCRTAEGWKISEQIQAWLTNPSIANAKPADNNKALYQKYAPQANELLYYDMPQELIVVEKVNKTHKVIYFVAENKKYGSFLYRDFTVNPQAGDVYSVRFYEQTKSENANFYKIADIHETQQEPPQTIYRIIKKTLNIKQGNSFGFAGKYFVPPDIIAKNNLINGYNLKAVAVYAYNRNKKEWAWKVVKILN